MLQAGRSWRKDVRTHISLDIANPAGALFQVLTLTASSCKNQHELRLSWRHVTYQAS